MAFEVKCPKPGKTYTTDVYYKLPNYFAIQVMAEVKSKNCNEYLNICYNPTSTTVIHGEFNSELCDEIMNLTAFCRKGMC